jgi:threonine dehydrogenase-like Zn-dependent dehydrogenase
MTPAVPSTRSIDGSDASMRAAVLTAAGKLRVDDVPIPEPGEGEVRIRLAGCGVCSSNLGPWSGPSWMKFPTEPGALGHEGWGVVDKAGPGVQDLRPGQRVAALFYNSYAEYDVGPASQVVPLPLGVEGAVPAEPLGCAMNIFRRSGIENGQTVAIVGIGFLGAILARLATNAGARVIAISRRPFALDIARAMGAAEALQSTEAETIVRQVEELTAGALCPRVIEATGKQGPLDLASRITAERGRLVIAGYHQDGPRQVDMQLWNWRGIDVVNAHERDPRVYVEGMQAGMRALQAGLLPLDRLITHAYPLERLDEALDATRDRPDGFLKAVVTML